MNIGFGANNRYKQITAFLSTFLLLFSTFAMPLADAETKNNPHAPLTAKQVEGSQINFEVLAKGRLKIKLSNGKMIDKPVEGWDPEKGARYNDLTQKINLLFGDAQKAAADCKKAEFDHFIAEVKKLGDEVQDNVNKDKKYEQALWSSSRKIQDHIAQAENQFKQDLKGSELAVALKGTAYLAGRFALVGAGFGGVALLLGAVAIVHGVAAVSANNTNVEQLTGSQKQKMNELMALVDEQDTEILKQAVSSLLWNNLNKAVQIRLAQLERYEEYFKKNCNKDKAVGVVLDRSQSESEDKEIKDDGWQDVAKEPLTDEETGQPLKNVVISITPKDSVVVTPSKQKDGTSLCRPFLKIPLDFDPLFGEQNSSDAPPATVPAITKYILEDAPVKGPVIPEHIIDNMIAGLFGGVPSSVREYPSFELDFSSPSPSTASTNDCPEPQREPFVFMPSYDDFIDDPSFDYDAYIGDLPIKKGDTVRVKATCHEKYEGTVGKDKPPSTVVKSKPIKVAIPMSQGHNLDVATVIKELGAKGIIIPLEAFEKIKWKMLISGTKAGPSVVTVPVYFKKPKKKAAVPAPAPKPKKKKIKVMVLDGQGKYKDIDKVVQDLKKQGIDVVNKAKLKWKPLIKGSKKGPATVTVPPDSYNVIPPKTKKADSKPKPKEKIKVFLPMGEGKDKDIDKVIKDLDKKGIKVTDKSKVKWKPLVKGAKDGSATVTVPPDAYTQPKTAEEKPKTTDEKPKKTDEKAEEASPCPKVTDSGCCGDPPDENISYEPNRDRQGKGAKTKELKAPVISDPHFQTKGSWGQSYDDQWALKRIGLSSASQWPEKYSEVIVAVIDTGIDTSHPDLRGSLWTNKNEIPDNGIDDDNNGYIDDYYGWNFVDDNANIEDNNGHGTLTAGIIGAWGNNGIGIASVNPHARIMPVKVTDFDNKGGSIELAQGIVYAVANGARVINVSIGGKYLTKVEQAAVDYAIENSVVVVVASGNEGTHTRNTSPAGLPGVITVASTDLNDERVNFSNWGPAIDLAAPGVDILSLRAKNTDFLLFENEDYEPGKAYVGRNKAYYRTAGSSFSAPFVAGVASLLLSVNPQLTADELKRMLLYSARDIDVPGKDQYTGYGLLDAQAALQADPAFYVDAEIDAVQAVQSPKGLQLQVSGKAVADQFKRAWLELGVGKNPTQWKRVSGTLKQPVEDGVLLNIPLDDVRGASQWTIRLITEHKNGRQQENRYNLKLQ